MTGRRENDKRINERCEKRGGGHLSQRVGVLGCALCFGGWVTQSEDDWSFVQAGHGSEDIVGEEGAGSGHTWKSGRESAIDPDATIQSKTCSHLSDCDIRPTNNSCWFNGVDSV